MEQNSSAAPIPPPPSPQKTVLIQSIKNLGTPESLKLLGFQAAAILSVGIVLALCYLVPLLSMAKEISGPVSDSGMFYGQFRSLTFFILLIGAVLGGGLSISGAGMDSGDYGQFAGSLSLVSITALVAIAALNLVVTSKYYRGQKALSVKRAALTAGLHSLVLAVFFVLFALLGRINQAAGDAISVSVSARYGSIFVSILALVFFTQFFVLSPTRASAASAWFGALREGFTALVATLALFAVLAVIVVLVLKDEDSPLSVGLILVPLLGTLGSFFSALAFLGTLAPGSTGMIASMAGWVDDYLPEASLTLKDFAEGKGLWFLAATAVLILVLSLFIGVRRPRTHSSFNANRIWQMPLISIVLWGIIAGLTSISMQGKVTAGGFGTFDGSVSFGMTWYSVVFIGIGMFLVSALAEVLPTTVYRLSPALLSFVGGKKATHRWLTGTDLPAPAAPVAANSAAPTAPVQPAAVAATERAPLAAPVQPAPLASPEPMSPEQKKRVKKIGFGLLGAAVVVGLGFAAVAVVNSQRKPEAQVEAYLQLLANGKADQANAMVDPGIDNASRTLLNDAVLGGAEQKLVLNDVKLNNKGDDSASVTATYSINGERQQKDFTVSAGKKDFGLFETWKLEDPFLVPVYIGSSDISTVLVGETEIPLPMGEGGYGAEFYAYPGIYEVSAKGNKYLEVQSQQLRAANTDYDVPNVTLMATASAELNDLVLKEVRKFSTACTTVPTNMDSNCPYSLQDTDLASFSVASQAESVELSEDMSMFNSSDVTFKYKENDTEYYKAEERETTTGFYGSITWTDGKPTVSISGTGSGWF